MTTDKRSRRNLSSREPRLLRWRDAFPRFLPLLGNKADGIVRSLVGFCRRLFRQSVSRPRHSQLSWTQYVAQAEPLEPRQLLAVVGTEIQGEWVGTDTVEEAAAITLEQVEWLADAAAARWQAAGIDSTQFEALQSIDYRVTDLDGGHLAAAEGFSMTVTIDSDAAGQGWFADATPLDDSEFAASSGLWTLDSRPNIDLLSVMIHEQGHLLGLEDVYARSARHDVMHGFFEAGQRRLPAAGQADEAVAGSLDGVHYAQVLASNFDGVDTTTNDMANGSALSVSWDTVDGIVAPPPSISFSGTDGFFPTANEISVDRNLTTEGAWTATLPLVLDPGTASIELTDLSFNWRVTNNTGGDNSPSSKTTTWTVEIIGSTSGSAGTASDSGAPGNPTQLRTIDLSSIPVLDNTETWTLSLTASGTNFGHNASLLDLTLNGDITAAGPTVLIDDGFQTDPLYPNGTANPSFPGWTWTRENSVKSRIGGSDGAPGDTSNQLIQFEYTDATANYAIAQDSWSSGEAFTLTLNASPQAWNGHQDRYIRPSIHESNGVELWSSEVLMPKYDNFGLNPWTAEQTFEFVILTDGLTGVTEGEALSLKIAHTGFRGIYIDNVHLTVGDSPEDNTPPDPTPLTWEVAPEVGDYGTITMTASNAGDPFGVEYYFENVTAVTNSGWQDPRTWTETGLDHDTEYTYRVRARDKSPNLNATAWSTSLSATTPAVPEGTVIATGFEAPRYSNNTADPGFFGWTWQSGNNVKSRTAAGTDDIPVNVAGDNSNQAIQFEYTSATANYDTSHGWSADEVYTLTLNASPQSWSGTADRYIAPSLLQQDGTVLWSDSVLMPKYDDFGRNEWTDDLTFTFVIQGGDFTTGIEGEPLSLRIAHSGQRGIYVDNVLLTALPALAAADDDYTTSNPITEDQTLTVPDGATDLLANDTPTDATVVGINGAFSLTGTSVHGAAVTLDADGGFTYDPAGSATIQALDEGEPLTDSFTYTMTDDPVPTTGRFVRVQNIGTDDRRLDIGEIEVFAPGTVLPSNNAGGNAATDFATAAQGASFEARGAISNFSKSHGSDAQLIDGAEETGADTWGASGVGTFVIIDLGQNRQIDTVRVHQRNDGCCQDRLRDFAVSVLADDGTGNPGAVVGSPQIYALQPPTNLFGEVTFPRVPAAASDTATVSIRVNGINDPPVASDDTNAITELVDDIVTANTVTGDLFANDTDVDDPVANFGVAQVSHATSGVDTSGTIAGDYGTLTYTPNSSGNSGSYTYTLDDANTAVQALLPGQTLTDTFTYTVTDNHSDGTGSNNPLTDIANLVITIKGANDSPNATNNTAGVTEDAALTDTGNVIADDDGNGADSDVDGPTLTVISAADGSLVTDPNVDVTGTYGSLNWETDGSYAYTLDNGLAGVQALAQGQTVTDTFTYSLNDSAVDPAVARFVQVIESTPNEFHLSELEVFALGVTPDNGGGASFGGLSTSTNDIAGGVPYNIADVYPAVGTTATVQHGNVNNQTNNALESSGAVWSTNLSGQNSQFTLDLGDNFAIGRVRAWPRADTCCTTRWDALTINLYADDGTGNPGPLVRTVNIADPDANTAHDITIAPLDVSATDTATLTVTVTGTNDAPVLTGTAVSDSDETGTATLSGTITDVDFNTAAGYTLEIDWADPLDPGTIEIVDLANLPAHATYVPATGAFTVTHSYGDDQPSGTSQDTYNVQVTAWETLGYQLQGLWNFDGGDASDASVNANHGTVGNGITFVEDTPTVMGAGQAAQGTGAGYVGVANSPSLQSIDDQLTVAFWVKADAADNPNWVRFIRKGTEGNGSTTWMVNRDSTTTELNVRTDTTGSGGAFNQNRHRNTGDNALDGSWHHIAYVLDTGSIKEYVDGTLNTTQTYPHGNGLANTSDLRFLGRGSGNVTGLMDDVAVWSRALTGPEVNQIAAAAVPINVKSDTVTVGALVRNIAPTANADNYLGANGTNEDSLLTATVGGTPDGLLANDTDPAGVNDPLEVIDVQGSGGLTALSDFGATVTVLAGGGFTYDPRSSAMLQALVAGETVQDAFTYTIDDGDDGTDTATVTVEVAGAGGIEIDMNRDFPRASFPTNPGNDLSDDAINVTLNGGDLEIRVGGILLRTVPAAALSNASAPHALSFTGSSDNDTLTLDDAAAWLLASAGVTVDGGGPTTGSGDSLAVTGGSYTTVIHHMSGPDSGTIDIDGNVAVITYADLEPVDMSGSTATDFIFNLPAGDDNAQLSTVAGNVLRLESTDAPVTFEQTDFVKPTAGGSITINGGTGSDTLLINSNVTLTSDLGFASLDGGINLTAGTLDMGGNDIDWVSGTNVLNVNGGTILFTSPLGEITMSGGTNTINLDSDTLGNDDTNIAVDDFNIGSAVTYTRAGGTLQIIGDLTLGGAGGDADRGNLVQGGGAVTVGGDLLFGGDTAGSGNTSLYDLNGGTLSVTGNAQHTGGAVRGHLYVDDPNALTIGGNINIQSFRTGDNQDGSHTVIDGQTAITTGTLLIGTSAVGTLTFESTGNTAANMTVGDSGGAAGSVLTLQDAASLQVNGPTDVGDANGSDGTINILGGSSLSTTTDIALGQAGNAHGEINVIDGSLTVAAGGLSIAGDAAAASDANTTGAVVIGDGVTNGTVIVSAGNTTVGFGGTGTLTLHSGSFTQATNNVVLAQTYTNAHSDGTITVNDGTFDVGNNVGQDSDLNFNGGTSIFNHNGGDVFVERDMQMAADDQAASDATYNLDAGSGSLDIGRHLLVGRDRQGEFNFLSGTFSIGGTIYVGGRTSNSAGAVPNANGTINIDPQGTDPTGATLTFNTNQLEIGRHRTGVVNQDGATVNVNGAHNLVISQWANGNATYNLNAGILNVLGAGAQGNINFNQGTGVFNQSGGEVHLFGDNINLTNNASGNATYNLRGGILDLGGGSLVTAAGAETFTWTGGRLKDVNQFATVASPLDLVQNNTAAASFLQIGPDLAADTMTVAGNYTQTAGTLEFDIDGTAGAGVASGHDQLIVNGTVSLAGDLYLDLNFTPTVTAGTPDSFTIIANDGTGDAVTGTFNNLPEGATFFADTGDTTTPLEITYKGGDGNDVVISYDPTPVINADEDSSVSGRLDNDIIARRNGALLEVEIDGGIVMSTPFVNLTDLTVNGQTGDDEMTVNYSAGDPVPVDHIIFNGDGNVPEDGFNTPGDKLFVTGGIFGTVIHDMTTGSSGQLNLGNSDFVDYTGLEPVVLTGSTIVDLILNLPAGADNGRLSDQGGFLRFESTDVPQTFERTDFVAPSGSLTINGGAGDVVTVSTAITIGADLSITADTINIDGGSIDTTRSTLLNESFDGLSLGDAATNLPAGWTIIDNGTGGNNPNFDIVDNGIGGAGDHYLAQLNGGMDIGPDSTIGGYALAAPATAYTGPMRLEFDVNALGGGGSSSDAAIVFGYQDAQNYYMLFLVESQSQANNDLFRVMGGTRTKILDLDSPALNLGAEGTWHDVVVEHDPNTGAISVSVDGVAGTTVTDTTFGGGGVGFGSANDMAGFDNIVLTELLATPSDQTYTGSVVLGANTTLTGSDVTVNGSVDSAAGNNYNLTVDTTGTGVTIFGGAVGGNQTLGDLTTNADGSTQINGGAVTTTGNQAFDDSVTLGADTTLTVGGNLSFGSTLDDDGTPGNANLTGRVTGTTTLGGDVGGIAPLTSIDLATGGPLGVGVNVTADGDIDVVVTDAAPNTGDDLTISAGTTQSNSGNITLTAGDAVNVIGAGTAVTASSTGATVTINVDPANDPVSGAADPDPSPSGTTGGTVTITAATITTDASTLINGGDDNDTFSFAPQTTTQFILNGNPPVAAPGDVLNLDISATTSPTLTAIGTGSGIWNFGSGEQRVIYLSIEDVDTNGDTFGLVIDTRLLDDGTMTSTAIGDDGGDDVINVTVNGASELVITETGTDNLGLLFQGAIANVDSLTVIGSGDNDTLNVNEGPGGLPGFSGSPPAVNNNFMIPTPLGTIGPGGDSLGAHLNAAADLQLETVLSPNSFDASDVGLHFDGEGGAGDDDTVSVNWSTAHLVSYTTDDIDADGSGNIGSIVSPTVPTALDFSMSYGSVSLANLAGSGATDDLIVDASATRDVTTLDIDDDTGSGDGITRITGNDLFTTATFTGFGTVGVVAGGGEEVVTLAGIDSASIMVNLDIDTGSTADFIASFLGLTPATGTPAPDASNEAVDLQIGVVGTFTSIDINTGPANDSVILADTVSLGSGLLDAGTGDDWLDYTDYSTGLTVDLVTGTAPFANSGNAGGLVAGTTGNSVENVLAGSGADTLIGDDDNNILGDGLGDDTLSGNLGDDIFLIQPDPAGGSSDTIDDEGGYDTVSFGGTGTPTPAGADNPGTPNVTVPSVAATLVGMDGASQAPAIAYPFGDVDGVIIDMDIVDAAQPVQTFGGGASEVSLVRTTAQLVVPVGPSPFENVAGSAYNDLFDVDPLGQGEDGDSPLLRRVWGNPPVLTDGPPAVPPGDTLQFDAGNSEVRDTGTSLTALGIGSVLYDSIENVEPFNALPWIIDNDDPGYTQQGHFRRTVVEGYLGDERTAETFGEGDNNVARWTFAGVTPGFYRVAVTWQEGPNRADAAQYQVFDELGPIAPIVGFDNLGDPIDGDVGSINQEAAPDDFREAGGRWETLSDQTDPTQDLFFEVSPGTSTLTVELPYTTVAGGFVMADAVRIERITNAETEIQVVEDATALNLQSGLTLQDLGTTEEDIPVVNTYTITNVGLDTLEVDVDAVALADLNDNYASPAFDATIGATSLPPGQSTVLTVTLLATDAGSYGGKILLNTNDFDENPFELSVMGLVVPATPEVPPVAGDTLVVDNDDDPATFLHTGDFRYIHRDTRMVDDDYRYANVPDSGTARWTFTFDTPGPRLIEVAGTWAGGENRATNAPYRFYEGDGTLITGPVLADHNTTPNDFEDFGIMWETIGTVILPAGQNTLIVELGTDGIDGYVHADAIRAGSSEKPEIQVFNSTTVFDTTTELIDEVSSIDLGYTELFPSAPVIKTFTVRNVGGEPDGVPAPLLLYEPINVPLGFTVIQSFDDLELSPGESTTFIVQVDAAAPGNVGGEISFGNNDSNETPFEFNISANVGVQIVDNDDPGSTLGGTGDAFKLSVDPRYYGGDVRYHIANPDSANPNHVDWTFDGLTPGRFYKVAATWQTGNARASNAPYTVTSGANSATVRIDQGAAPDDFADAGENWEELTIIRAGDTTMTVRLSDDADDWVYADAIRIEQVYLPEVHVTVDGVALDPGDGIDLGKLLRGSAGEQDIEVTNAGLLPLVITDLMLPNVPNEIATTTINFGDGEFASGESFTIRVNVDTSVDAAVAVGAHNWAITFDSNDVDELSTAIAVDAEIANYLIVDDGDAGFSPGAGSTFLRVNRDTRYYGNDYYYKKGAGSSTVAWEFTGLADGTYDIFATWYGKSAGALDAPYKVYNGLGTELASDTALHRYHPDDIMEEGEPWELVLDDVVVDTDVDSTGTLKIELGQTLTTKYVFADAVMIQFVGDSGQGLRAAEFGPEAYVRLSSLTEQVGPSSLTANEYVRLSSLTEGAGQLNESDLSAAVAEATSLWQSTGLTAAEAARLAAVDVRVAPLASNVLGWAAEDGTQIWIDTDAAGHGWRYEGQRANSEGQTGLPPSAFAPPTSMDLLTVLAHELGHVIGREHGDEHGVMDTHLGAGERALPGEVSDSRSVISDQLGRSGQRSVTSDQLFSGFDLQPSAFSLAPPASSLESPASSLQSTTDALFARLDDEDAARIDTTHEDDDRDESGRDESEDALDLWSVLFGLDA